MPLQQAFSVEQMKKFLRSERDGVTVYRAMAKAEKDARLADVYARMADAEQRHADAWAARLAQMGSPLPVPHTSLRARFLRFAARRFGASSVISALRSEEATTEESYPFLPEERSHARLLGQLKGGASGSTIMRLEGRHRGGGGGNALRAGVLGANDGLLSNLSLVMGVAGAQVASGTLLLTGIAGLLAGASSMAIGEWLSVQSARELHAHQIETEREELRAAPEEEAEELALIYEARGVDPTQARSLAQSLVKDEPTALDALAREELGIDPEDLGGSAWQAALVSFALFAAGAIVPVVPFLFLHGLAAVVVSAAIGAVGLFALGAATTLFTARPPLLAGFRQVALGLAAAVITFGVGRLVGTALG